MYELHQNELRSTFTETNAAAISSECRTVAELLRSIIVMIKYHTVIYIVFRQIGTRVFIENTYLRSTSLCSNVCAMLMPGSGSGIGNRLFIISARAQFIRRAGYLRVSIPDLRELPRLRLL